MPVQVEKFRKLRGAIRSEFGTNQYFSLKSGIGTTALSRKLCGKDDFKLSEMYEAMRLLNLPTDQMHVYFPKDGVESTEKLFVSPDKAPPNSFKKLHTALESANISRSDLAHILGRSIEYMNGCFEGERAFSILEAYTILEALKIPGTKFPEYFPKGDLPSR